MNWQCDIQCKLLNNHSEYDLVWMYSENSFDGNRYNQFPLVQIATMKMICDNLSNLLFYALLKVGIGLVCAFPKDLLYPMFWGYGICRNHFQVLHCEYRYDSHCITVFYR
jgi:hypothetical protein